MTLPGFLRSLFWDINQDIDTGQKWFFIIERVLEQGNIEAVGWVFSAYPQEKIKEVVKNSRALSFKTISCWREYFRRRDEERLQRVISSEAGQALSRLLEGGILEGFYLSGGMAIALNLSHRTSSHFDFLTEQPFDHQELEQKLHNLGSFSLIGSTWGSLEGVFEGVRFSFVHHQHPLLYPTETVSGIEVASLTDLALMKLAAVALRGYTTDFVDLYFLTRRVSLEKLFELYPRKYPGGNLYTVIRSLGYFDDADKQPLPRMNQPVDWPRVKDYFLAAQQDLLNRYWGGNS